MSEFEKMQDIIKHEFANTNSKIETIQSTLDQKINDIHSEVGVHNERIKILENYAATDSHRIDTISYQLETLKQDRLRNNLRLTGLPPPAFENTRDTIMKIVTVLQLDLLPSDFIAYNDRNKSSIILAFDKYAHKRYFMETLRSRNGVMVEEILQVQSNSQLFCNDQLTPFFANLFQKAWQAKKNKQLYSASSMGGRVKVRKTENSNFVIIESEQHLIDIIENIDNSAPAETSSNNINESPSSLPSNRVKPVINSNPLPKTVTELGSTKLSKCSTYTIDQDRQPIQRINKFAAPSNEYRDTIRNQQWQQMRQKQNQNHHNEQPRNGQRYKQQDRRRQIDLSPNQYSHYNNKPTQSYRNNSRNYSSHRYEDC